MSNTKLSLPFPGAANVSGLVPRVTCKHTIMTTKSKRIFCNVFINKKVKKMMKLCIWTIMTIWVHYYLKWTSWRGNQTQVLHKLEHWATSESNALNSHGAPCPSKLNLSPSGGCLLTNVFLFINILVFTLDVRAEYHP